MDMDDEGSFSGAGGVKPEAKDKVFFTLETLFASNLKKALKCATRIDKVELHARCFTTIGKLLDSRSVTVTEKEICKIYDEIFADTICSLYLAGCGLDKPAHAVLRRVLELGMAAIYLWDLPHAFWAWKNHDADLTFNEILEHFSSSGYRSFVAATTTPSTLPDPLFDFSLARREYRSLSNTIHGKISTFETTLPNRFSHTDSDWTEHVERTERIESLLINAACVRFPWLEAELKKAEPELIPV
jgi:hypothetical protein